MITVIAKSVLFAIMTYFFGLFITRVTGRKMISQMTFFDFVIGAAFGSLAANMALDRQNPVVSATTVLVTFALLTVALDFTILKSFTIQKWVESEPVVVVENGRMNEQNLRRVRVTLNELMTQLRKKNIFNVADMEFAVMETDGQLSILPKSQKQPVTPSDLNIPTRYKGLTRDIILDGVIMTENLTDAGLDESWLRLQLQAQGMESASVVFYAGLDTSGTLYISRKNKRQEEKHGKYGIE